MLVAHAFDLHSDFALGATKIRSGHEENKTYLSRRSQLPTPAKTLPELFALIERILSENPLLPRFEALSAWGWEKREAPLAPTAVAFAPKYFAGDHLIPSDAREFNVGTGK